MQRLTVKGRDVLPGDLVETEDGSHKKVETNTNGMIVGHRMLTFKDKTWGHIRPNDTVEVRREKG